MRWLSAVGTALAALIAGTAQAGTVGERHGGNGTAFSEAPFGFVQVNAPSTRRCDFINNPGCTGVWSNARRKPTAFPGDAEAPTRAGLAATITAASCPPGTSSVGTKGECVEPKPLSAGCPPGTSSVGTKGECVEPKPPSTVCPPGSSSIGTKGECVMPLPMTIPEPATLPLVMLALGAALALRRGRSLARPLDAG
jgi:hypothetical protein